MPSPPRPVHVRARSAVDRLARGHPWVWRESLAGGLSGVRAGDEVTLIGVDGEVLGHGIADPEAPIAVRSWTHGAVPLDAALWRDRAERACALRGRLFAGARTTAMRMLHGEGDRMPGFVVDRYGDVAVARADGEAAEARMADLAEAIAPALAAHGVSSLVHRRGGRGERPRFEVLRGAEPPAAVTVEEHGVPFVVDLAQGQKTGAFLDQRDNRKRVGELARARRVLNLYSYAGGFSLHAALGGAVHVTSVDIAAAAHATAQQSFRVAGLDPGAHAFVTADVRDFLDRARGRGESWDLVVSDPPSFAPSEKAVPRAIAAYRALHRACAAVLAPGGLFCASSCSSHVDAAAFLRTLDDAALGGRELSVLEVRGAGADHTTLADFPEGRYLKFVVMG
ncbi:MAG: class I SAM-dependent rRNA methyltransferase [Myxococcales bacterium]|nr:class I SAM-dependent rRNA methyltransferase [Myxococcales bacterium]